HGIVARWDGRDREASDPGPEEDGLRDECAFDDRPDLNSDEGDHGDEGVLESVACYHGALAQAFRARGPHVVVAKDIEEARADLPEIHGETARGQSDGRQDQPPEVVAEILRDRRVVAGRQDMSRTQ